MKTWQVILGATALSFLAATAIVQAPHGFGKGDAAPALGAAPQAGGIPLPWLITAQPDGRSAALGLTLGHRGQPGSTLADARQRFGLDMQIAIIAAPGEDGSLEAFVDPARAGFIAGKLVITAELTDATATLKTLRERAVKSEFMESTTRKYTLSQADEALALQARIVSLNFIPQASLDADTVLARFGTPAQRLRSNAHQEHFLYPDKGLDVIVDSEGKELLQYVAPHDFERLRAPLIAAASASAASAAR